MQLVNAAATVPVYVVDKLTGGGKPPKAGEEPKPQSAGKQVRPLFVLPTFSYDRCPVITACIAACVRER